MPLALQTVNGVHVAALSGPLDHATASDLVASIKASVDKSASIVLDCTLVPTMDVGGFKHLLALHRWSQAGNGRLILAGMSPEAWSLIVENHCENTFESRPSVPAALQALGASEQPSFATGEPDNAGYGAPPEPFMTGQSGAGDAGDPYIPTGAYSSDPMAGAWGQPASVPPPAEPATWSSAPAGGDDPWEPYKPRGPASTGEQPGPAGGKKSRLPLYIGLGVAAVLLVFGVIWLIDYLRVPEITVSESRIEVLEDKDPGDLTISVSNGKLQEVDRDALPNGLYIDGPADDESNPRIYHLAGAAQAGATSLEVQLYAERNGRVSKPASLLIKVKPKPLEWLFQPPKMKVGFAVVGYTKIAAGAKAMSVNWKDDGPGGLDIKEDASKPGLWLLVGNPAKDGKYGVEFTATDAAGASLKRSYEIEVEKDPAIQPQVGLQWPETFRQLAPLKEGEIVTGFATIVAGADTVKTEWQPHQPSGLEVKQAEGAKSWNLVGKPAEPGSFQLVVTAASSTAAPMTQQFPIVIEPIGKSTTPGVPGDPNTSGIRDEMRSFLLERIEKANEHFTEGEKESLRTMVSLLIDAKTIATVKFGTGKTTLSERESRNLKSALKDDENRALLDDKDCQILVVGYASPSGPMALNVRLSRGRANSVNKQIREILGRGADLCGDYGPTDLLSENQMENQAVEVFAGKLRIPGPMKEIADRFKDDFNRRHGGLGSAE